MTLQVLEQSINTNIDRKITGEVGNITTNTRADGTLKTKPNLSIESIARIYNRYWMLSRITYKCTGKYAYICKEW